MVYAGVYGMLGETGLVAAQALVNEVNDMNVLDSVNEGQGVPQRINSYSYDSIEQSCSTITDYLQKNMDPGSLNQPPDFKPGEAGVRISGFDRPTLEYRDAKGREILIRTHPGIFRGLQRYEITHRLEIAGANGSVLTEESYDIPSPGILRPVNVTLRLRGEVLSSLGWFYPLVNRGGLGMDTILLLSALFFAQYRESDLRQRLCNHVRMTPINSQSEQGVAISEGEIRKALDRWSSGKAEQFLLSLATHPSSIYPLVANMQSADEQLASRWLACSVVDEARVFERSGTQIWSCHEGRASLGSIHMSDLSEPGNKHSVTFSLSIPEFIDPGHWQRFSSGALINYLAIQKAEASEKIH